MVVLVVIPRKSLWNLLPSAQLQFAHALFHWNLNILFFFFFIIKDHKSFENKPWKYYHKFTMVWSGMVNFVIVVCYHNLVLAKKKSQFCWIQFTPNMYKKFKKITPNTWPKKKLFQTWISFDELCMDINSNLTKMILKQKKTTKYESSCLINFMTWQ
jgi:hypothetical protein